MKVTKRLYLLMQKNNISMEWLERELGLSHHFILKAMIGMEEFDEPQAQQLIAMFGAEEMAKVINWEGMNVSCPI